MPAEWQTGRSVHGCAAGVALPPHHRNVNVSRVDLDQPGYAAGSLGRDEARAAAPEWIENDPLPIRTVLDRIGHQGDRLDGWIRRELASRAPQNVLPGVVPDIGSALTAPRAGANMVDVRAGPDFEHKYELMLGSISDPVAALGLLHTQRSFISA